MKFNMGCGHNRAPGYVNVDASPVCEPDEVWDLEQTPWPWADGCAEEVLFIHSLEHMGGDPKVFLAIMKELYRIAAPDCSVVIHVPHPRHDMFLSDPTHVRALSPATLALFDRSLNDQWKVTGSANTPLAHYIDVDFRIADQQMILDPYYRQAVQSGALKGRELDELMRERNNIVTEHRIKLRAVKEAAPG